MAITKTQLGGAISVVCGIFLFKSLTYSDIVSSTLENWWYVVAGITLVGILFHNKIAEVFVR